MIDVTTAIIIGCVGSIFLVAIVLIVIIVWCRRKRGQKSNEDLVNSVLGSSFDNKVIITSTRELPSAKLNLGYIGSIHDKVNISRPTLLTDSLKNNRLQKTNSLRTTSVEVFPQVHKSSISTDQIFENTEIQRSIVKDAFDFLDDYDDIPANDGTTLSSKNSIQYSASRTHSLDHHELTPSHNIDHENTSLGKSIEL